MKLRFTAIAGLLLSLPLTGFGQGAIQVTAGSYNPTYAGVSGSFETSLSMVSVGGVVASASYLNDSGFTAFASPGIAAPTNLQLLVVDNLDPLDDGTGAEGGSISLNVEVEADRISSYTWYKGGSVIEGETGASLTLSDITNDTEGNYSVAVANQGGVAQSADVAITVIELPVFLSQPSDKEGAFGGSVIFRTTARVEGTATYAWYKDGVLIDGATSKVLSLTNLGADDIASYTLEISNEAGSVTSDPAAVSILTPGADQVPAALLDSYFVSMDNGMTVFNSAWFGNFSVKEDSEFGWVWTDSLGWTYFALLSTPEESYIYPLLVGGIFYITEGLYPDYVYSYNDGSWVLMNPTNDASTGSIWGWVYELNDWVEYSE